MPPQPAKEQAVSKIYELLRLAAAGRQPVAATYDGLPRLLCPHVLGRKSGRLHVFFYQVGGSSNSGLPMVSVAHYYSQNGDAMRDPEMVFEVDGAGQFHPVSFQQDNLGLYHEAVFVDDAGRVMVRPRLVKHLASFARVWDKNLKEQGFVDAARAEAQRRAAAG